MSCVNLFPYQSEALEMAKGFNRVAFYHDM